MDSTDKPTPEEPVMDSSPEVANTETEQPAADDLSTDDTSAEEVTDAPDEATEVKAPDAVPLKRPSEPVVGHVRHKPPKKLIVILVVVFLIAAGALAWAMTHRTKPIAKQDTPAVVKPKTTAAKDNSVQISAADKALLAKFINPTTGESWYASPVTLSDQKFLPPLTAQELGNGVEQPVYTEVGTRSGNKVILTKAANDGPGGPSYYLFEVASNGTVRLIAHPDGRVVYDDTYGPTADLFTKSVIIDKTTHYDSLTIPGAIDLGNGYAVISSGSGSIADSFYSSEGSTLVKQLGSSAIVKTSHSDAATGLTSYGYMVQFPFKTTVLLKYDPLETALKDYKWNNAVATDDKIAAIARGCGGVGSSVTSSNNAKDADFVAAGTSPTSQVVYDAKDPNYILVNKAYDEFHKYYEGSTTPADKAKFAMTKVEFIKQHGVIFYKDKSGAWLVYARQQLAAVGGCAKPVVYLYPTSAEQVNVRVGADVKISVPFYNATTGWNVWAQPNGQLTLNGTVYDSLFWEGPGQGVYPSITGGTVVARSQAVATIRSQLAQQGLNAKETNDFVAYWESKIPNKPYVRLTWFNTAQLNELAPLVVTPKPNTLIRVFLDMDGLDKPISLPAQHLSAIPRTGFTVVEWGGLSLVKL